LFKKARVKKGQDVLIAIRTEESAATLVATVQDGVSNFGFPWGIPWLIESPLVTGEKLGKIFPGFLRQSRIFIRLVTIIMQ
jgi:hypothetical protein